MKIKLSADVIAEQNDLAPYSGFLGISEAILPAKHFLYRRAVISVDNWAGLPRIPATDLEQDEFNLNDPERVFELSVEGD